MTFLHLMDCYYCSLRIGQHDFRFLSLQAVLADHHWHWLILAVQVLQITGGEPTRKPTG
jgi:hypothetical protein